MRTEREQARKGSMSRLVGAAMGLALVSVALLSMGGVQTKHATSFIEAARPEAAVLASTVPGSISPGQEVADRDVLDLQLD